jgi:hypothetical protein
MLGYLTKERALLLSSERRIVIVCALISAVATRIRAN